MPPPAAMGATSTSFPKPSRPRRWLPKLSLPRFLLRPGTRSPDLPAGSAGDRGTQGLAEVFRRFDADGDGKVSGAEMVSFLAWAGEEVSAEEVEGVVGELDSDGDGLMDYGDFVRLMGGGRGSGGGGDGDLRAAFEMLVAGGGGGCITAAGLRRALGRLGEARSQEECAAMIRAFDADGNGVLDYQEFYRMMT